MVRDRKPPREIIGPAADVTPGDGSAIARSLTQARTDAVQEAEIAALAEVIRKAPDENVDGVQVILDGASPDDEALMRRSLGLPKAPRQPRHAGDELAPSWRSGGFPYKYKMLRRDYEQQK